MILFAHMLLGAVVGYHIKSVPLAILLALLCHYFLDLFPHVEYSIHNINSKLWKKSLPDFLKVFVDFSLVFVIIFFFSGSSTNQKLIICICAFIAAAPDAFTLISSVFEHKILKLHNTFHTKHVHYLTKQKKFPLFWRIFTQVASITICIWLLR